MPHQCTNCGRTFADGSKEMLSGCPDCSGTKFQFRPEGFEGDAGSGPADTGGDGSTTTDTGAVDRTDAATTDTGADSVEDLSRRGDTVSRTVGSAAATVRDLVGGSAGPDATTARPPDGDEAAENAGDDDIIVAEPDTSPEDGPEDAAQADARGSVATSDDLPGETGPDATDDDGHASGQSASLANPAAEGSAPPDSAGETATAGTTADPTAETTADPTAETTADPTAETTATADATGERTEVSEPDTETADRPGISELRKELNEQFESIRVVEPGQYELNLMELYDREEYIIALQEDGRYSIQVPETWRDAED